MRATLSESNAFWHSSVHITESERSVLVRSDIVLGRLKFETDSIFASCGEIFPSPIIMSKEFT